MLKYYEQRRPEYEAIYTKPERQNDLVWIEAQLSDCIVGKRVLEIACGTGYWSRRISAVATSLHATDASGELASAAVESCNLGIVSSGVLNAFNIPPSPGFECLVAGFFFSHVLLEQRSQFIEGLASAVDPGTCLIMFDNNFVPGSSTKISRQAVTGDTYQLRMLSDGSSHEVLKNFPSADELSAVLTPCCSKFEIRESKYFWFASGVFGG